MPLLLLLPLTWRACTRWLVMAADYCQIELRLMAHFSGDVALCAMLSDPKQDPFILLAAQWKGVDVKQVGEGWGGAARLAYGLPVGQGPCGTA